MKYLIAVVLVVGFVNASWANHMCGPRKELVETLLEQYQEVPLIRGETPGVTLEMFVAPRTGTWTVITVDPDGVACVQAAGNNFSLNKAHLGEAL